jgi:hypothetical protein
MNPTQIPTEVLQAATLKDSYHHARMVRVKSALLTLALRYGAFDASQIDAGLCVRDDGTADHAVSGVCVASLQAIGLIEATGERVRSSRPDANARRVNRYRLAPGKQVAALAWFRNNAQTAPSAQQELAL